MKTTEWVAFTLKRTWQFLQESFSKEKELAPIEEDPVGEFLEKKKSGRFPAAEKQEEAPQSAGDAVIAPAGSILSAARSEKVEATAASGVSEGQEAGAPGVTEEKTEAAQVVPPVEVKAEEAEAVSQPSEEAAHTRERSQMLETVAPGIASTKVPPTGEAEKAVDDDTESLLEVFKTEQEEMETLGTIARELADMSVYSLLEEGKRIAAKIRCERTEPS
jgi:hypothetical protein